MVLKSLPVSKQAAILKSLSEPSKLQNAPEVSPLKAGAKPKIGQPSSSRIQSPPTASPGSPITATPTRTLAPKANTSASAETPMTPVTKPSAHNASGLSTLEILAISSKNSLAGQSIGKPHILAKDSSHGQHLFKEAPGMKAAGQSGSDTRKHPSPFAQHSSEAPGTTLDSDDDALFVEEMIEPESPPVPDPSTTANIKREPTTTEVTPSRPVPQSEEAKRSGHDIIPHKLADTNLLPSDATPAFETLKSARVTKSASASTQARSAHQESHGQDRKKLKREAEDHSKPLSGDGLSRKKSKVSSRAEAGEASSEGVAAAQDYGLLLHELSQQYKENVHVRGFIIHDNDSQARQIKAQADEKTVLVLLTYKTPTLPLIEQKLQRHGISVFQQTAEAVNGTGKLMRSTLLRLLPQTQGNTGDFSLVYWHEGVDSGCGKVIENTEQLCAALKKAKCGTGQAGKKTKHRVAHFSALRPDNTAWSRKDSKGKLVITPWKKKSGGF